VGRNDWSAAYSAFELSDTIEFADSQHVSPSDRRGPVREGEMSTASQHGTWSRLLRPMADNRVEALAYPTIRCKANVIGEMQMGTNCQLGANSGLSAIVVRGSFTPDGLPVGVELLGRAWSEPQLIKFAYAYEQATRQRRPPAGTLVLVRP
jgi:Asp-tRNA(Asn)/Glu-tRNA(Gln) amidotransferase A subunit family amidase